MITPRTNRLQVKDVTPDNKESWQWHLQHAIRRASDLSDALSLPLEDINTDFPLLVPRPYLARIEPGNPRDPLLLQILPRQEENLVVPGFTRDPVGESHLSDTPPGLLQKYTGRALVTLSGACAINCRYCFRRHFPYEKHQASSENWQDILTFLNQDDSLSEVILSGGDPLMVNDRRLAALLRGIEAIPHIDTLRIHTRLPVVIPQRITASLLESLAISQKQIVMVLHINHPNEIDLSVRTATARLREVGITLLNQTVLLQGVNSDADTLYHLSKTLFGAGVLPYYLHALDRVAGAAHFDVDEKLGSSIVKELQNTLPGYLVPRFVREEPNAPAKQWIDPR